MTNSCVSEKRIRVTASGAYDVVIGKGLIERAGELILEVAKKCKLALVTDDTVNALYADKVIKSLENAGYIVCKYVFPHGEESKNISTYGNILNFLAQNSITRTDALVALGGGVVGDMAGFAAATFLRGIKYVQIPTTLLSQIDSSVGGKTAIDLPEGKNLVGAFKQPSLVICDTDTLNTLPKEIFADGMGEAAKYAILDKKVYELVQNGDYKIEELVYLSVDYKRRIVEADEFEGGMRKLLNLGHTPAHGIENLSGYTIPHGRAVAMGLNIILNAAKKHGYISEQTFTDMVNAVEKCAPKSLVPFSIDEIARAAFSDKKRSGDDITLVMPFGVEDCRPIKIKISEMAEYLK